jgi:hypothetical protein
MVAAGHEKLCSVWELSLASQMQVAASRATHHVAEVLLPFLLLCIRRTHVWQGLMHSHLLHGQLLLQLLNKLADVLRGLSCPWTLGRPSACLPAAIMEPEGSPQPWQLLALLLAGNAGAPTSQGGCWLRLLIRGLQLHILLLALLLVLLPAGGGLLWLQGWRVMPAATLYNAAIAQTTAARHLHAMYVAYMLLAECNNTNHDACAPTINPANERF